MEKFTSKSGLAITIIDNQVTVDNHNYTFVFNKDIEWSSQFNDIDEYTSLEVLLLRLLNDCDVLGDLYRKITNICNVYEYAIDVSSANYT